MDYQIKTQAFEGPLDLLLHLISKSKVDIKDIFVSEITEQYLEYISTLPLLDMETASEFLSMAATLLYIKSRSLFPNSEETADDEEIKQNLIFQLEEYKRFKEVSAKLRNLEESADAYYYKLPEDYLFDEGQVELDGVTVKQLCEAFSTIIAEKIEIFEKSKKINVIRAEKYSVRQRIAEIKKLLKLSGRIKFSNLYDGDNSKGAVVATFIALLELINGGIAKAVQENLYDEIIILAAEGSNG